MKCNAKCKFHTSQSTKLLLITLSKLRPNQENCRLNSLIVFIRMLVFGIFAAKMSEQHLSAEKSKHQVLDVFNFCLAQGALFPSVVRFYFAIDAAVLLRRSKIFFSKTD